MEAIKTFACFAIMNLKKQKQKNLPSHVTMSSLLRVMMTLWAAELWVSEGGEWGTERAPCCQPEHLNPLSALHLLAKQPLLCLRGPSVKWESKTTSPTSLWWGVNESTSINNCEQGLKQILHKAIISIFLLNNFYVLTCHFSSCSFLW